MIAVNEPDSTRASSNRLTSPSGRIPELDGLRALSIMLVLAGHLLPLNLLFPYANSLAAMAGMSLFFSLSGFLITQSLIASPDLFAFGVKRLARIVPLAWAYIFFCWIFFFRDAEFLFVHLFFLSNYVHEGMREGTSHFWSLCVEIHFYIAVALAVKLSGQQVLRAIPIPLLMVTLLRIDAGAEASIPTHLRVDEILSGATLALIHHGWFVSEDFSAKIRHGLSRLLPLAGLLWLATAFVPLGPALYLRPYATAAFVGGVVYTNWAFVKTLTINPITTYVATISYALYVFHGGLRYGYFDSDNDLVRYLVKRPQTIALTFLLAHLSTYYWERPWLEWGKKLIRNRAHSPAPSPSPYLTSEPRIP